jgi:hypothetical protein
LVGKCWYDCESAGNTDLLRWIEVARQYICEGHEEAYSVKEVHTHKTFLQRDILQTIAYTDFGFFVVGEKAVLGQERDVGGFRGLRAGVPGSGDGQGPKGSY